MKSILEPGLSTLTDKYDGYLIDIYGVVFDGQSLYDGVVDCLEHLSQQKKSVLFMTNAPVRAAHMIGWLENIGIAPSLFQHVLTSGEDTFLHLQNRTDPWYVRLGDRCYYLGPSGEKLLEGLSIHSVRSLESADFILVVGADDWHEHLSDYDGILKEALELKIPMICANPNQQGFRVQAGTIAHAYEQMGGRVRYHGKPDSAIYRTAMTRLAPIDPARILAIGDSLDTDIQGAINSQLDNALVSGGAHVDLLQIRSGQLLEASFANKFYKEQGIIPTYTLPGLIW